MKLFDKPFSQYLRDARVGIGLLLLMAIVRFLLQPLFQIPSDQGTNWVSLTILLPIIMLIYSVAVARRGGDFSRSACSGCFIRFFCHAVCHSRHCHR